jgi:hypothetical protein
VKRVLHPGGRLVIADLARPHNRLMRLVSRFPLLRRHHGRQAGSQHAHGGTQIKHPSAPVAGVGGHDQPNGASHGQPRRTTTLEDLLAANGWQSIAPTERYMSVMGTIALYTLTQPDEARPV